MFPTLEEVSCVSCRVAGTNKTAGREVCVMFPTLEQVSLCFSTISRGRVAGTISWPLPGPNSGSVCGGPGAQFEDREPMSGL